MNIFLTIILLLFYNCLQAQDSSFLFREADKAVTTALHELPSAEFYLLGQAHGNKANTPLEQTLLFSLHKQYGVRYDVLEYGHCIAFLLNEYLETGNDSLRTFFKADAKFSMIKAIREYNAMLPPDQKIKFFGIDFESRQDDRFLKKAIDILLSKNLLKQDDPLFAVLQKIQASKDNRILLAKANSILVHNEYREVLKDHYLDVLLITSGQYTVETKRDDEMFASFKLLYSELIRIDKKPMFIASFGFAHFSPRNLGSLLQNDTSSPVRNKVSLIGVQYYNCSFLNNMHEQMAGNLSFICNKKSLPKLQRSDPFITYINVKELESCKGTNAFVGFILIGNIGRANTWD